MNGLLNCNFFFERECWNEEGMKDLKSVDGSFPCHPISFHWSDTNPRSSVPGKEARQRASSAF